ncbi:MAG TPA: transketolase [Clostridia bacterium]|nr:transketolase [Clostridia bacterium]
MNRRQELELKQFAAQIRLETIKEVGELGFGHLAGSLSVADALAVLYGKVMRIDPKNPDWPERDLMVMSKGHAGPAVYATLALKGYFPMDWLKTLNKPDTRLPSHCDRQKTPGIDMTTGSLGQGASTATGMALGRKLADSDIRVFLFVGDGECNEGQVWEAAMFSAHHKLDKFVWFVDYNKRQLDGFTKDVLDLGDIAAKFKAFGFYTQEVDGNDVRAISDAIDKAGEVKGQPSCIILDTVKGHGASELVEIELNHHVQIPKDFALRAEKEVQAVLDAIEEELRHV